MLTVLWFWYRIVFIYLKGTDSEIFALDKKLSLDSGCDRKRFRVLNNKCSNCLSLSTPSTPSPPPPASPFTFVPNSLSKERGTRVWRNVALVPFFASLKTEPQSFFAPKPHYSTGYISTYPHPYCFAGEYQGGHVYRRVQVQEVRFHLVFIE